MQIIIADDHPLIVEGIRMVLDEMKNTRMLKWVCNGRQLIDELRSTDVDMVLLDLNMPKLDGIDCLKIIKTDFPKVKVIVLTNYNQPELIKEIKELGAQGFLLKNDSTTHLKEAINTVVKGNTWFPVADVPLNGGSPFFTDSFMKKYQLTKQEVEIIRLIIAGIPTREIGERLFVSEFTINAHRRNICRKLNVHTPVGLINFAKEHGLV
jgi:DNA-binding NarL/FixJ family response regulator